MPTEQYDQATVIQALKDLGVNMPTDLQVIQQTPYVQAVGMFDELKKKVKKAYRRLVVELHPDRTGNDPEKEQKFKVIKYAYEEFNKLQLHPPVPRPMMRMPMQPMMVINGNGVTVQTINGSGGVRIVVTGMPGFRNS